MTDYKEFNKNAWEFTIFTTPRFSVGPINRLQRPIQYSIGHLRWYIALLSRNTINTLTFTVAYVTSWEYYYVVQQNKLLLQWNQQKPPCTSYLCIFERSKVPTNLPDWSNKKESFYPSFSRLSSRLVQVVVVATAINWAVWCLLYYNITFESNLQ